MPVEIITVVLILYVVVVIPEVRIAVRTASL